MQIYAQLAYGRSVSISAKSLYVLAENPAIKNVIINQSSINFGATITSEGTIIQQSSQLLVKISS